MHWDAERYDSAHCPQIDVGLELIKMAGIKAGDSILDIGCGTGRLTCELALLAHKGMVVGIDPSVEMLDRAGEKLYLCLIFLCSIFLRRQWILMRHLTLFTPILRFSG